MTKMTLNDLNAALRTIPGFDKKIAYRAFPVGKAPKLPFICYQCTQTDNFFADGQTWQVIQGIDIELYTAKKDMESEQKIESKLAELGLGWEKYEDYIDSENCYMITYSTEIEITENIIITT